MERDTEFWTSHVDACQRQGCTPSLYARRHGLTLAPLYYWLRKLTLAADGSERNCAPAKFVALRVVAAATDAPADRCTLVLSSGLRLEMTALPSPARLLALDQANEGTR